MSRHSTDRRPHPSRSSMREVAERAGVAMSSVSRVLADHPDVSPKMRERVMAVVEELGYKPNLLAKSLRKNETLTVGFVVGNISNPLLATIVAGSETTLRKAGYSMMLTNSENDPDLDAAYVRLFEERRVDGLILSLASEDHEPTLRLLRQLDVPLVCVDRELSADVRASYVLSDHGTGMSDAVDHLLDLGHRRIGLILGQPVRASRERRRALEQAFSERRLPKTYEVIEGTFSVEHGERAARRLLDEPELPTAIIAGGNQLLIGVLQEAAERNLRIGRDLSVITCDDTDVARLHDPPIAVVNRDTKQLGIAAAELLLRQMRTTEQTSRVLLPTEFVTRPSCGPPSEQKTLDHVRKRGT